MRQRTDADGKSEVSRVLDTVSQKRAGQNKPKQVIQAIQQLDIETTSLSTRTASKFPCVFLDLDRDAKKCDRCSYPLEMSEHIPSSTGAQPGEDEGCSSGKIDHTTALTNGMAALLSSEEFSDVTFVANGERLHAHRLILITRSEYFRAMLTGGLKESVGAEVELQGKNPLAFRTLLRYIYTGKAELSAFTVDDVLAILELAHEYMLIEVQEAIAKLDITNVFTVAQTSTLLSLDALTEFCNQFYDRNAPAILECKSCNIVELLVIQVDLPDQNTPHVLHQVAVRLSIRHDGNLSFSFPLLQKPTHVIRASPPKFRREKEFLALPEQSLIEMLRRDSFCADESDVFAGVAKWIAAQPAMELTSLKTLVKKFFSENCVRLNIMSETQLLSCLRNPTLFPGNPGVVDSYILNAIRNKRRSISNFRGTLKPNENVVSVELGAPEVNDPMVHKKGSIITITLDRPYTINLIVSMAERWNWKYIANNEAFDGTYNREISFDACVVRYISVFAYTLGKRSAKFPRLRLEARFRQWC
ncbi:unnamed protein product [Heligmosomoides polygyrus]|uniref:BTB domain-containing protein n=1 Tax=Heligmosomoides polygyrus TaxID=6339 RepID=A0A3P7WQ50_HELPZ|nr:unnamed protein product [Heligmosomoides polygyrus]